MRVKQIGFTLIELMITVAIIGILAAIALPQYRDYVTRSQLSDAHAMLSGFRTRLEQYYQDNRSYPASCGGTAAGLPTLALPTATKYFSFTCGAGATAGQTYFLNAHGVASTGTAGFQFRIDDQNNRSTVTVASGWTVPSPNNCWVTKKGGGC